MKKSQPVTLTNEQYNHNFDLEDWDIEGLFKDTVWLEFLDDIKGDKTSRGGIIVPDGAQSLKDFYRVGRILKVGPDCTETVYEGAYIIVPPNLGMKGLKKGPNGGQSLFIREELIMAVIAPKTEQAVKDKEEKF